MFLLNSWLPHIAWRHTPDGPVGYRSRRGRQRGPNPGARPAADGTSRSAGSWKPIAPGQQAARPDAKVGNRVGKAFVRVRLRPGSNEGERATAQQEPPEARKSARRARSWRRSATVSRGAGAPAVRGR